MKAKRRVSEKSGHTNKKCISVYLPLWPYFGFNGLCYSERLFGVDIQKIFEKMSFAIVKVVYWLRPIERCKLEGEKNINANATNVNEEGINKKYAVVTWEPIFVDDPLLFAVKTNNGININWIFSNFWRAIKI